MNKQNKNDIIFLIIILVGLIILLCSNWYKTGYAKCERKYKQKMENTNIYKTWVKLTGNPKKFTKEEFLILKKAGVLKLNK